MDQLLFTPSPAAMRAPLDAETLASLLDACHNRTIKFKALAVAQQYTALLTQIGVDSFVRGAVEASKATGQTAEAWLDAQLAQIQRERVWRDAWGHKAVREAAERARGFVTLIDMWPAPPADFAGDAR